MPVNVDGSCNYRVGSVVFTVSPYTESEFHGFESDKYRIN